MTTRRPRPLLAAVLAVGAALAGTSGVGAAPAPASRVVAAAWADGGASATERSVLPLLVSLAAGPETRLTVRVTGATVVALPDACAPSTVVRRRSHLSADAVTLVCTVVGKRAQDVVVEVRTGAAPGPVGATVTDRGVVTTLPGRAVAAAAPDTPRRLRLISSPDFMNADVADLRRGPGFWNPRRSPNSTSPAYERAIDRVLDDWQRQEPDGVLVAGDLVDGRWGRDSRHTGNFGPVGNAAQRASATRRAAATYYPQYLQRFRSHHLDLYPAVGDHEYGDNPWTSSKRRLAPVFQQEFARYFTRTQAGRPRFRDHPGGVHASTAYAFRPSPEVQVVSIDPFDISPGRARIRVDRQQLRWLAGVLRKARADGVRWTLVQGHVPILEPVRARGSSELHYPGGARSRLWQVFRKYGVDVYLCGEVHDVTATTQDGILQLAHGGAFQFGLTTYSVLDVHDDRLDVTLRDYAVRVRDARDHTRLWETVRSGLKKWIRLDPEPVTIGTLTLGADGSVTDRSGILLPYRH
ncbi:metallophosphoesterase family protein [Nocardioides halotolerans]|uniref:metallophosphoesterase family protein n=1 Tax=Nocardioides halotolerans TaxID=433660 RepID=UPI00041B6D11|nr:metallophosphoesterase [Nocardioides halotolerans]